MKARTWIGWVVTGMMAALMLLSAAPDVFGFLVRLPCSGISAIHRICCCSWERQDSWRRSRSQPWSGAAQGMGVRRPDIRSNRCALLRHLSVGNAGSGFRMPAAVRSGADSAGLSLLRPERAKRTRRLISVPVEGAAARASSWVSSVIPTYTISAARVEDLSRLSAIDLGGRRALSRDTHPESVLNETTSLDVLKRAQREGRLRVALADDVPVAVAHVEVIEPDAVRLRRNRRSFPTTADAASERN